MENNVNDIRDVREKKDFSKLTFSNYKKQDVIKEFIKSLKDSKHEASCYWSAELICSGYILELWESIILYVSKFVHIGNPKLPIYIKSCIDNFRNIVNNNQLNDDLQLRNDVNIRKLFAEICVVLVDSNRKHSFGENIKVSRLDFDISNIGDKLKAPHVNYIKKIFKEKDTKEIYIALNELYYNIKDKRDAVVSCYWVEWILEFDVLMRKYKKKNLCERRTYVPVDSDDQINIIWMIWDVFFDISQNPVEIKIIESLLNIFCLKFSKGVPKKRKYILYFIVTMLTERVNYNLQISKDPENANKIKNNINLIYREIKKNEIIPKSDYLLANLKSNREKSIEKMKILNSIKF